MYSGMLWDLAALNYHAYQYIIEGLARVESASEELYDWTQELKKARWALHPHRLCFS